MSTVKEIQEMAYSLHDDEHAEQEYVFQVWNDGEVTMQVGKELWKGNLYFIAGAVIPNELSSRIVFPRSHRIRGEKHTYIFAPSREEALKLRKLMDEIRF